MANKQDKSKAPAAAAGPTLDMNSYHKKFGKKRFTFKKKEDFVKFYKEN